jgi:membrane-bound inhibitor of C-type lysozyme
VARYGALSDGSLHFVRIALPDGRDYTLPQVLSASGVRYTDERALVWWEHQGRVRVEMMDAQGKWETKYSPLEKVPEEE